jgi:hypothetical protein
LLPKRFLVPARVAVITEQPRTSDRARRGRSTAHAALFPPSASTSRASSAQHLAPNAFAEDYDRLRDHLATGGGQVVPMRPAPTRGAGAAVRLAPRPTQVKCATGAERAVDVDLARQELDEDAEREARASGQVGR